MWGMTEEHFRHITRELSVPEPETVLLVNHKSVGPVSASITVVAAPARTILIILPVFCPSASSLSVLFYFFSLSCCTNPWQLLSTELNRLGWNKKGIWCSYGCFCLGGGG